MVEVGALGAAVDQTFFAHVEFVLQDQLEELAVSEAGAGACGRLRSVGRRLWMSLSAVGCAGRVLPSAGRVLPS